jgi:1-acyl-sn-glycerol-3-phosphate acyltransferase
VRRRMLLFVIAVVAAISAVSLSDLKYREDISDFLPVGKDDIKINDVLENAGNSEKLIVGFSANDREIVKQAVEKFEIAVKTRDSLAIIPEIVTKTDEEAILEAINFIQSNIPYFLTGEDYRNIDNILDTIDINAVIKENRNRLMLPTAGFMKKEILNDPLNLFNNVIKRLKNFHTGGNIETDDGYIFSNDKGLAIIKTPFGISETKDNKKLLEIIQNATNDVTKEFPQVKTSIFGAPAIAVTNAEQIKLDSMVAISLAIILIFSMLAAYFRNTRNIVLIFLSVGLGYLVSLGILAAIFDTISVIAVGAGSVFIGIAVNYPLHLIDSVRKKSNIRQALKEIVPPLVTGNITTVCAFMSITFINSPAMKDLGLFGSLLLIFTIIAVLVALPHVIHPRKTENITQSRFHRITEIEPDKNKYIIIALIAITVILAPMSRFTKFETDINKINYMTKQQKEDMKTLIKAVEKDDTDNIYIVAKGKNIDNAINIHCMFMENIDTVIKSHKIESISTAGQFLISNDEQHRRIKQWNNYWNDKKQQLTEAIQAAAVKQGFKKDAFKPFTDAINNTYTVKDREYFAPLAILANNYLSEKNNTVTTIIHARKQYAEDVQNMLREYKSPNIHVISGSNIGEEIVKTLSNDFNLVLSVCTITVFLFLTLSFGRLEIAFASFLPLAVSWIWILGIMHLTGVSFNIINIILATLIFGQGDDYTILITEGLIHEHTYRRKVLPEYRKNINLSALITISGIGTLIIAKHPALKSLGEITIVGMTAVLVTTNIIPPLIFRYLTAKNGKPREQPWTIRRFITTTYAFIAFIVGSIILTVAGAAIFGINRKNKRKSIYHKLLYMTANLVIRRIPDVKFTLENIPQENFLKPAVIISNHQSHLDLMCILMLNPKTIIITNDHVWNSPFYGQIIRYAGFYPISGGIESIMDNLRKAFAEGYSIAIFPEGTRSENNGIKRFHKGTFHIASELDADIIPVIIHGAGHVLPKNDFMLRKGSITARIGSRITPSGGRFTGTYAQKAKDVRKYYIMEYNSIKRQKETAQYYENYLKNLYTYKLPEIRRGALKELKIIKDSGKYEQIDNYAGNGEIEINNTGYGVYSILFALVHGDMKVTATWNDPDMLDTVSGMAGLPPNIIIGKSGNDNP